MANRHVAPNRGMRMNAKGFPVIRWSLAVTGLALRWAPRFPLQLTGEGVLMLACLLCGTPEQIRQEQHHHGSSGDTALTEDTKHSPHCAFTHSTEWPGPTRVERDRPRAPAGGREPGARGQLSAGAQAVPTLRRHDSRAPGRSPPRPRRSEPRATR